jgi:SulP family sulfate permease
MIRVWRISAYDGAAAAVTFGASLLFAPHMIYGILIGAGLSIVLHLYKTMKPRLSVLGTEEVGSHGDSDLHVRFDGRLYFASARHFEDTMEEVLTRFPDAKRLIIHGEGINHIDTTGVQAVSDLVERLNRRGIIVSFAGLKHHTFHIFARSGLDKVIGKDNFL